MTQGVQQLFVTSLSIDSDLVTIFGQQNPLAVSEVERTLLSHISAAQHVTDYNSVYPGLLCYVCNADAKFIRVRVQALTGSSVYLKSVDYGFDLCAGIHELRIPCASDPLLRKPDLAEGYFVANVRIIRRLNQNELALLRQGVVFQHLTVNVTSTIDGRAKVAVVFKGNQDIRCNWLKLDLVGEIASNLQENMIRSHLGIPSNMGSTIAFPNVSLPPPSVGKPPPTPTPVLSPTSLVNNPEIMKALVEGVRGQLLPTEELHYPAPFKTEVGTTYISVVSDISYGPWSFSVQLMKDKELLERVADEMQKVDKVMVRPPVVPGKSCIAYYGAKNMYARGIILKVNHTQVEVNFVDYGGTEELHVKEVFEIPSQCLRIHKLAQIFCLSQLPAKLSKEEKACVIECFSSVVKDKSLLLKVTPSEETGVQTCELYEVDGERTNVKILMNSKMKQSKAVYVTENPPDASSYLNVFLTHVESPSSFYVQDKKNENIVNDLYDTLQEVSGTSAALTKSALSVGLPCLSLFSDGAWYRAKITNFNQDLVTVFFVDYGNTDTVPISSLRELAKKYVLKPPTLALACCLKGFEDSKSDMAVEEKMKLLLNEQGVSIHVTSVEPGRLIVKLFRDEQDIVAPEPAKPKTLRPSPDFSDDGSPNGNDHPKNDFGNNKGFGRHFDSEESGTGGGFRKRFDNDEGAAGGFRKRFDNEEGSGGGFRKRFDNEDGGGGGFKKRFDNEEGGGGFRKRFDNEEGGSGGFRKRFDNEDGGAGGFRKRFDNEEGASGGFRKRFDNEDGGGGGFKKRFDNEEGGGGGFRKRFDNAESGSSGGFRKRFENDESGGFKKSFDGDGGFKKSFNSGDNERGFKNRDDNNSDGGFKKKFGGDDGPTRPTRTPVRREDRAPEGSSFDDQIVDPGTTLDVTIPFFYSPYDFYVHTSVQKDEFATLMQNMQTDYVDKFCISNKTPPKESDIVVARFSEDRVLYRAEVLTASPLTVRFVDYGNCEEIKNDRNVFPVMKKLLDLPKQSIRCSLIGVKPTGDNWAYQVGDHFEGADFKCSFISFEDNVYKVKLVGENGDVATALISAGLAVSSDSEASGTGIKGSTTAAAETPCIEPFNLSFLPGQTLLATIAYVESAEEVYIHLNSKLVESLEQLIAGHVPNKKNVEQSSVKPGEIYLCALDPDTLYRGKVINVTDTGSIVQFIDYGDMAETPFSEMYDIPTKIKEWPVLAVKVALVGNCADITDESLDAFKNEFEQQIIIIAFKNLHDERLSATIYTNEGKKVVIPGWINDDPDDAPVPELPLTSDRVPLIVKDFTGDKKAIVSLPGTTEPELTEPVAEDVELADNAICAALCEGGVWRRAIKLSNSSARLIDFGTIEAVSEFRPLPAAMRGTPAYVREVDIKWPFLGQADCRVTRNDTFVIEPIKKEVWITHVDESNELYGYMDAVANKVDEIQGILAETQVADVERNLNDIVAAQFPEDEAWYRGRIESVEPLTVHFIDYGNSSEVTEVAPLPPQLIQLPPLSNKFSLAVELDDAAKEQLKEMVTTLQSTFTLVEENHEIVDMINEENSVLCKLYGHLPLFVDSRVQLSHLLSPSHFFVQRCLDIPMVEQILEKLETGDTLPEIAEHTPNLIVAAKHVEHETWYRGRIEDNKINFIDYGDDAALSDIRELPADLAAIPPLAQRVALVHPKGEEWTDAATEKLTTFLDGQPLTLSQLKITKEGYLVSLSHEGQDLASLLETEPTEDSAPAAPIAVDLAWPVDLADHPTDDDKSRVTDDERAERNETDEQKRGKMEGPRSDDEKCQLQEVEEEVEILEELPEEVEILDDLLEEMETLENPPEEVEILENLPDEVEIIEETETTQPEDEEDVIEIEDVESPPTDEVRIIETDAIVDDEVEKVGESIPATIQTVCNEELEISDETEDLVESEHPTTHEEKEDLVESEHQTNHEEKEDEHLPTHDETEHVLSSEHLSGHDEAGDFVEGENNEHLPADVETELADCEENFSENHDEIEVVEHQENPSDVPEILEEQGPNFEEKLVDETIPEVVQEPLDETIHEVVQEPLDEQEKGENEVGVLSKTEEQPDDLLEENDEGHDYLTDAESHPDVEEITDLNSDTIQVPSNEHLIEISDDSGLSSHTVDVDGHSPESIVHNTEPCFDVTKAEEKSDGEDKAEVSKIIVKTENTETSDEAASKTPETVEVKTENSPEVKKEAKVKVEGKVATKVSKSPTVTKTSPSIEKKTVNAVKSTLQAKVSTTASTTPQSKTKTLIAQKVKPAASKVTGTSAKK